MSLMDTLKGLVGKGKEVAAENADKIQAAVDKAGGFIDEKTHGKYSDQIGKGAAALKNAIPEQPGSAESGAAAEAAPAPQAEAAPAVKPPAEVVAEPAPPAEPEAEAAPDTESVPEAAPPSDTEPEPGKG
ncbi:antitoxin [Nocardia vaccinii]|uniref:antitoxin n=1 Tax=Nocardia vaccinii TaxID=1822 RepID=UPI00082EE2ED|nr:antitoxin [Nocardia vaccinii]